MNHLYIIDIPAGVVVVLFVAGVQGKLQPNGLTGVGRQIDANKLPHGRVIGPVPEIGEAFAIGGETDNRAVILLKWLGGLPTPKGQLAFADRQGDGRDQGQCTGIGATGVIGAITGLAVIPAPAGAVAVGTGAIITHALPEAGGGPAVITLHIIKKEEGRLYQRRIDLSVQRAGEGRAWWQGGRRPVNHVAAGTAAVADRQVD